MKATVHYILLTKAQTDELNNHADGWGSPIGRAYLAAKDGRIDATNFDLLERAATMEAESAEEVWTTLQNHDRPWTEYIGVVRHTDFPRSMDVGDVIVWEDGTRERCIALGFETIGVS